MGGKTFRLADNTAAVYAQAENGQGYKVRKECRFYREQKRRRPTCVALKMLYCSQEDCCFFKPAGDN